MVVDPGSFDTEFVETWGIYETTSHSLQIVIGSCWGIILLDYS